MLSQLSKIVVRFSPWKPGSKAAREFLSRITAAKVKAANPQCEVLTELRTAVESPSITVTHAASKTTETIVISGLTVDRIIERLRNLSDEGGSTVVMAGFGGKGDKLSSTWDLGRNDAGTARRQAIQAA